MDSKIKTFEDACKALNLDPEQVLPDVSGMPEKHQKAIVSHAKLVIIAEALNDGWKPDWTDDDQLKYYPWFRMDSGSGLAYYVYGSFYSTSCVGSRLCFKSRELAIYAGKQFTDIYADFMTL